MALWCGCAPLINVLDEKYTVFRGSGEEADDEPSGALERYLAQKRLRADSTTVASQYIAVMPFENTSGFREDVWDVELEMSRMLNASLKEYLHPNWQVVPFDVVTEVVDRSGKFKLERALEAGRALEADMILLGTVSDYDMKRVSVGDPLLGGYKSYTGVADLELKAVWVLDQRKAGMIEASREVVDRDLGLDLLGKPRKQDLQFLKLKDMTFGSEEFLDTAIGQATLEAVDELAHKVEELIRPSGLKLGGQPIEILSIHEDEVYINIGSENRLHKGYRFEVYPGPRRAVEEELDTLKRIGAIEVQEVIGARLTKVRVLQGQEQIRAGDRLKLMEPENE